MERTRGGEGLAGAEWARAAARPTSREHNVRMRAMQGEARVGRATVQMPHSGQERPRTIGDVLISNLGERHVHIAPLHCGR